MGALSAYFTYSDKIPGFYNSLSWPVVRYQITHKTLYCYSQPVRLSTHTVRLRPRSDGTQCLDSFEMKVYPEPSKLSNVLDIEGNACTQLWFADDATSELQIETTAIAETFRANPFDYLSEPWAIAAPIDYPSSMAARLAAYLDAPYPEMDSPQAVDFAQSILHEAGGNVGSFLVQLAQTIYEQFNYVNRPTGDPLPAGVTLAQKAGSCRDFTVLFMAACRAVGLAARFVSGYQEGDPEQDNRDLHAWPEVYIPGGGWRGFDPTHGLAVCDCHIALAASAFPKDAAPVSGTLKVGEQATSTLDYHLQIQRLT